MTGKKFKDCDECGCIDCEFADLEDELSDIKEIICSFCDGSGTIEMDDGETDMCEECQGTGCFVLLP